MSSLTLFTESRRDKVLDEIPVYKSIHEKFITDELNSLANRLLPPSHQVDRMGPRRMRSGHTEASVRRMRQRRRSGLNTVSKSSQQQPRNIRQKAEVQIQTNVG